MVRMRFRLTNLTMIPRKLYFMFMTVGAKVGAHVGQVKSLSFIIGAEGKGGGCGPDATIR